MLDAKLRTMGKLLVAVPVLIAMIALIPQLFTQRSSPGPVSAPVEASMAQPTILHSVQGSEVSPSPLSHLQGSPGEAPSTRTARIIPLEDPDYLRR